MKHENTRSISIQAPIQINSIALPKSSESFTAVDELSLNVRPAGNLWLARAKWGR